MAKFTKDQLVEIIRLTSQDKVSSREVADLFECGKSTIGDFLRKETYKDFWEQEENKPTANGYIAPSLSDRSKFKGKRFVFSSAQNNTFVHDNFLKSLQKFCEYNKAELVVGTFHYNKKGYQAGVGDDVWYDPKIRDYICDEPMQIAEGLVWCGELNILPTAINPLSGLHSYTAENSAIVPHAKLQLESVPTPKYDAAKLMYTTGTVTQRNYIQMKAGQKAEWHHAFAALLVEIDEDGDWFVRQLNAESESGCFFDLDVYYTPSGVSEGNNIEAINYGDIHAAKLDEVVAGVSWRSECSILDTLKPKYQFAHDALDQAARNHHNIKDPHFLFKMFNDKTESVKDELTLTAGVLAEMQREFSQLVVVESNHDLALLKWIKECDYRKDPVNAVFFLELQLAQYKAIERGDEEFLLFENACKLLDNNLNSAKFLRTDESFRLCGNIECGQHGHKGNGGARGSLRAFQMQGLRFNVGHTHGAAIKDGVYYAGVSGKLDMGYNTGGGNWNQSHILTYTNGKRSIITLKNGKWRA